jgi:NAD(P)-dependent dehydrogenase (short-subunit alcohol dehydrogenase family)
MSNFRNKTVVVTGAAGALGCAVATFFSAQGARVAHLDISLELLGKTFPQYHTEKNHLYIAANLTDRAGTASALSSVIQMFGKIDVLANIAGGFLMGEKVHETTDATWDFLFDLNTRSILNTTAVVVPDMLKNGGGKIINISANGAKQGAALMGAYVASKAAVWRLTESMAAELREKNINVNCILPSLIDTPRNRADMPGADYAKWVPTADIAKVIGFLASDDARMIHGAAIPVVGLS